MARMLSPLASIIRGSVAGLTFTANQFHQIVVRQRTAPVQPGTEPQTIIRSAFSEASQTWRNMTQADRNSWIAYALTAIYTGPVGSYTVPGRSIFMAGFSLATYLELTGFATNTPEDSPPAVTGFAILGAITTFPPAVPGTGFDISIKNPQAEELSVLINLSLAFDETRNFYKGPWDFTSTLGATIPASSTVLVPIAGLVAGKKYFFRVKGVITDGPHRTTTDYFSSAIAATNP